LKTQIESDAGTVNWLPPASGVVDGPNNLGALNAKFYDLWRIGSNALVGWRPNGPVLSVIVAPITQLFQATGGHARIFSGSRLMGPQTFDAVARALGVKPVAVPLDIAVGDGAGERSPRLIEKIFSRYAVSKTEKRAVILIDIAGFSLIAPEQQAAQLTALEFALNLAEDVAYRQGMTMDLARSTTGDGFYLWNREKGFDADIGLCEFFMLMLAVHALLQDRISPSCNPVIRSCFSIGSHYGFHHVDSLGTGGQDYIVGDVTIQLARLMEHAERNQILFADFFRQREDSETVVDTAGFLDYANEISRGLDGVALGTDSVDTVKTYLTGRAKKNGDFDVRRLKIVDKHGMEHFAYNAKVNFFLRDHGPIYLGLQDRNLAPSFRHG
jgi:class 3 adenylate cyclase